MSVGGEELYNDSSRNMEYLKTLCRRQLHLLLLVAVACLVGSSEEAETLAPTVATTLKPQAFQARSIEANDEDDEFETQAQTHLAYRHQQQQQQQRPVYDYSQSEEDQEEPPRQVYQTRNVKQQNNYLNIKNKNQKQSSEEESEEEEEEPDRLSLLLAKSTFSCNSKTTGYYADESLKCEVFHYCQENQRHSWICPEGFTFHQIHLICMPPSNENICQQSSKYHIVNDYLYKPINLQEHQTKPNVTLRYSERYYPESYYENDRYEDEEEERPRQRVQTHRQPLQVGFQQQVQPQYQRSQAQPVQQVRHQPVQQQSQQQQQQQQLAQPQQTTIYRKPLPATTIQPQLQHIQQQLQIQQQHHQRPQTLAPAVTATPYRFFSATPQLQQIQQQQQQHVYRTPEDINISLQQRRPQYFVATSTPRFYEDEYLYER